MTDRDLRRELLALLPRLEIEVRFTSGEFEGGLIRLGDRRVLILNPAISYQKQADLICAVLRREDLSQLFVLPALRARIESRQPEITEPSG